MCRVFKFLRPIILELRKNTGIDYFDISNLQCCQRFSRQELKRCKTLTAACKEKLSSMVKRYQQQKKGYLESLKVSCHFYSEVNGVSEMK